MTANDYIRPNNGLPGSCWTNYWRFDFSLSADVKYWEINLAMTDPAGAQVDTKRVTGTWPPPAVPTATSSGVELNTTMCDGATPTVLDGTYTITGTLKLRTGADCLADPASCPEFAVTPDTFVLTRALPPWHATGKAVQLKSKPLTVRVKLTSDSMPAGYRQDDPLEWRIYMRSKDAPAWHPVGRVFQWPSDGKSIYKRRFAKDSGKYTLRFMNMSLGVDALRIRVKT